MPSPVDAPSLRRAPESDVVDASVIPHATDAGYSVVRIRSRGRADRRVVFPETHAARNYVKELGHAVEDRPWTFVAEPPVRWAWILVGLLIAGPAFVLLRNAAEAPVLWALLGLATTAALVVLVLRMPVHGRVALDGVAVRWLRFARIVPLEAIVDVTCETKGAMWHEVRFDLCDRDDVEVHFAEAEDAEILVERVREAIDAAHGRASPVVAPLLRPPRASAREWIDRLRAIGSGVATHRVAPVDPDELWKVVESALARSSDRAAAAIALAVTGDEARRRLRVVGSTVTQPRLRIALEAATGASEPALERALEEVDSAPPSSRPATVEPVPRSLRRG